MEQIVCWTDRFLVCIDGSCPILIGHLCLDFDLRVIEVAVLAWNATYIELNGACVSNGGKWKVIKINLILDRCLIHVALK